MDLYLSFYPSISLSIHHRSYARGWQIGRDDWTNKLWWEPSTAHHGAGKLSIPQFNMVRKWPLLGTCVVRDHWSWPTESSKRAVTFDRCYEFYDGETLHYCPTLIQIKSPTYFSQWFSFGFAVFLVCHCFFLHNICQRSHGLSAISISYLLLQLKFQMVVEVLGDFIFSCLLLSISTEIQETTEGRKLPVPGSQSLGTVFYVFAK